MYRFVFRLFNDFNFSSVLTNSTTKANWLSLEIRYFVPLLYHRCCLPVNSCTEIRNRIVCMKCNFHTLNGYVREKKVFQKFILSIQIFIYFFYTWYLVNFHYQVPFVRCQESLRIPIANFLLLCHIILGT